MLYINVFEYNVRVATCTRKKGWNSENVIYLYFFFTEYARFEIVKDWSLHQRKGEHFYTKKGTD